MHNCEYMKLYPFESIMYQDPQSLIFRYSPQTKHLRLLELVKNQNVNKNSLKDQNTNFFQIQNTFSAEDQTSSFFFTPKRCFLLDCQLAVIQKQLQGKPINYQTKYQKLLKKYLKNKIFDWYSLNEAVLIDQSLTQSYCYYSEINNFCFGRKQFVRVLNSIELCNEYISRNHCELIVQKGKDKNEAKKYFGLLFEINKEVNDNKPNKRKKLSEGNLIMSISLQLWQKIYQFLFLTIDKYFLIDNGSRNSTFLIQCPKLKKQMTNQKSSTYSSQIQETNASHQLPIKEGFSYEFQGSEFIIKVLRLTSEKAQIQTQNQPLNTQYYQNIQQIFPHYWHNLKIVKKLQQIKQKINWSNNFEQVSKGYLIDDFLLKRNFWKNKKVYENLKKRKFSDKNKKPHHKQVHSATEDGFNENYECEQSLYQPCQFNHNQPFSLLFPNQASSQSQYITKAEFFWMLQQECMLIQKYLKKKNYLKNDQIVKSPDLRKMNQFFHLNQATNQRKDKDKSLGQKDLDSFQMQIQNEKLFINQHKLSVAVIWLDYGNDCKKLYCIITEFNQPKKLSIGSQMVINTANFQIDQSNKCIGYINFDGNDWSIVSVSSKSQVLSPNILKQKTQQIILESSDDSDSQEYKTVSDFIAQNISNQQKQNLSQINRNKEKPYEPNYDRNLYSDLANKIWTKIPMRTLFQLNPKKCQRYLLRLGHSSYFQLKFINFNGKNSIFTC